MIGQGSSLSLESSWNAASGLVTVSPSCLNNEDQTCGIETVDIEGLTIKVTSRQLTEDRINIQGRSQSDINSLISSAESQIAANEQIVAAAESNWVAGIYYF